MGNKMGRDGRGTLLAIGLPEKGVFIGVGVVASHSPLCVPSNTHASITCSCFELKRVSSINIQTVGLFQVGLYMKHNS